MLQFILTLSPGSILLFCIFLLVVYLAIQVILFPDTVVSGSIDLVVFGTLFVLCLLYLQTNWTVEDLFTQDFVRKYVSFALKKLDTIQSVYFCILALVVLYASGALFSWRGSSNPMSFVLAKDIFWVFLILCLSNEFMKLAFQYSLFANLEKLLWSGTNTDEAEKKEKEKKEVPVSRGEVFHVGNQLYTYKEADELCRIINDSRLATKEELEAAHRQGANWEGSYGWCTNQQAYTISKEKGVQGGRAKRDDYLLGVNCVGKKPAMTDRDKMLMDLIRAESKGVDIMSQIKLLFAELNPNAFMTVRPFNFDKWSSTSETTLPAEESSQTSIEKRMQTIETEIENAKRL